MSEYRSSGGIGLGTLLGVLFITLKLCGVISWSWWWVTCPFWAIPTALLAFVVFCLFMHVVQKVMP